VVDEFDDLEITNPQIEKNYQKYFATARNEKGLMPNLKGMPAMDAVSVLENMGLKVQLIGNGEVDEQSVEPGSKIEKDKVIKLKLS
jgi:cell division protein FtsI (penicillin-binding protein 3)